MKPVLLLLLALGIPHDAKEEAIKKELAKLQGEWIVGSAEKGGKAIAEADRKAAEFLLVKAIIKDDAVTLWLQERDKEAKEGTPETIELDPSQSPKRMRLKEVVVIYSLDGDTLRVGLKEGNHKEFASSLDTSKDADCYVFVMKRKK